MIYREQRNQQSAAGEPSEKNPKMTHREKPNPKRAGAI